MISMPTGNGDAAASQRVRGKEGRQGGGEEEGEGEGGGSTTSETLFHIHSISIAYVCKYCLYAIIDGQSRSPRLFESPQYVNGELCQTCRLVCYIIIHTVHVPEFFT